MPDNNNGSDGRVIMARGIFRLRRRRGSRGTSLRAADSGASETENPELTRNRVSRLRKPPASAKAAGLRKSGLLIEKWQALGNDFLLVWEQEVLPPSGVALLCDRKTGVGADGVMFLSRQNDLIRAQLFNSDGSAAEYSGNGFRCLIAASCAQKRPATGRVKIASGRLNFEGYMDERAQPEDRRTGPTRELRVARLASDPVLVLDPRSFNPQVSAAPGELFDQGPLARRVDPARAFQVILGNPHLICLVEDMGSFESPSIVEALDRMRSDSPHFPGGVNVSLAQPRGPGKFLIRTWERGVGRTSACASAATALYFLLRRSGEAPKGIEVESSGGTLALADAGTRILVKGPARRVFGGTVDATALSEP